MRTVTLLPGHELPDAYYDVRYEVLRRPLGSPKGSEHLPGDMDAINVWMEENGKIVAVGRAHLIADNEDGSAYDTKAESTCPAFVPLTKKHMQVADDSGHLFPADLRPAVQIRGMGTIEAFRNHGLAGKVLRTLETESSELWKARTGWLQARTAAIPFYTANGWTAFDPEYHVPNVGLHRSMWKIFRNLKP